MTPLPRPGNNRDYAPFYAGVQRRQLLIQYCTSCGTIRHPPAPMCGHCHSLDQEFRECALGGELHSWVVHHHPPVPGFEVPFVIGLADMDEGFRLLAGLTVEDHNTLRVGLRVGVEFEETEPGYVLYRFRITDREEGWAL
jgi:3-oxo-4,17-pregnadiene-20-carboxyl-CoA hydratase alpha subunit